MADHQEDATRRITTGPGDRYDTHAPQPPSVADDRHARHDDADVLYETHDHHDGDVHGPSVHRRGESADVEGEPADVEMDIDANRDDQSKRPGDVLGLSDASPDVQIPKPADRGSGHAPGLDVRAPASGTGELTRSKGATGIDMGSGGTGTDLDPGGTRRGSGA